MNVRENILNMAHQAVVDFFIYLNIGFPLQQKICIMTIRHLQSPQR